MTDTRRVPAIMLSACINALGVAHCLGRHGVPVIAVTTQEHAPAVYSRWVRNVLHWQPDAEDLVDVLLMRQGECEHRPVLFPFSDGVVRALAARHEELRPYYRIRLPNTATVDEVMSKQGCSRWAEQFGVPIPETAFVDGPEQLSAVATTMRYPCIVKPEYQGAKQSCIGGLKTARAENAIELIEAYHRFCDTMPQAVVQEWIPGGDNDVFFCLQYYNTESCPLVSFCGRKIRQWPPLCGSTASCEPVHCPEIVERTTQFFTKIGFQGLCSMEYKRDPRNGRFLMIEPTVGRTDFQSAVANVNGVPIPYVAYCDLAELPHPSFRQKRHAVKWVRWSADKASAAHYRTEGELKFWTWLWSIRPPVAWSTWAWDDPMPWIRVHLVDLLQRAVRKVRRIVCGRRCETHRGTAGK